MPGSGGMCVKFIFPQVFHISERPNLVPRGCDLTAAAGPKAYICVSFCVFHPTVQTADDAHVFAVLRASGTTIGGQVYTGKRPTDGSRECDPQGTIGAAAI